MKYVEEYPDNDFAVGDRVAPAHNTVWKIHGPGTVINVAGKSVYVVHDRDAHRENAGGGKVYEIWWFGYLRKIHTFSLEES